MKERVYIAYGEESVKVLADVYAWTDEELESYLKSLLANEKFIEDGESYITKESTVCVVYDADKVDEYLAGDLLMLYMYGDESRYTLRYLAIAVRGTNYVAYSDKLERFTGEGCDWFFDDGLEVYGGAVERCTFCVYFEDKYLGSIFAGSANGYIDIINDLLCGSHPVNDGWEDGCGNCVSLEGWGKE